MKFKLSSLKTGDQLDGRVHEVLAAGELIISFEGDLIRVANETHRQFSVGDTVVVIVTTTDPLRFRLRPSRRLRRRLGHIDVNV